MLDAAEIIDGEIGEAQDAETKVRRRDAQPSLSSAHIANAWYVPSEVMRE